MKKLLTYLTILIAAAGCGDYETSDLNGRWSTIINNQYCELWIKNDLVLDWNDALGEIRIRKFRLEEKSMIFSIPDKDAQSTDIEFILEIINLNGNSITTKNLQHPDHPKYDYELIDKNVPSFDFDLYGSEQYQKYKQELIERGNLFKGKLN